MREEDEEEFDRYTKYCTQYVLIECITATEKNYVLMINTYVQLHILMNVFKKHLKWVKDYYDHESLRYLVKGLMMHRGKIKAEIAWVYVLYGSLTYHGMYYQTNESLRLKEHEVNFVSSFDHGLYVLLDKEYLKIAVENYYQRYKLRRIKFIREFLFAPYFLSDKYLMEFSTFIKVKHYSLNKKIYFSNCKHKIKLIYKGSVSMYYPWRRQLYLSILTPGLIIINKPLEKYTDVYNETTFCQMIDNNWVYKVQYYSKSDDTVLLSFDKTILDETPYNINPMIKSEICRKYVEYQKQLESMMTEVTYRKMHRNKQSFTQYLKRNIRMKEDQHNISINLSKTTEKYSQIFRQFSYIQLNTLSKSTIDIYKTSLSRLKSVQQMTVYSRTISNYKSFVDIPKGIGNNSQKYMRIKSFSTLSKLPPSRIYNKMNEEYQEQKKDENVTKFYVPDQFVSKKLRLNFEGVIKKMRNLTLVPSPRPEKGTLKYYMRRLEKFVNSNRTIKIKRIKRKDFLRYTPIC